MMIINNFFKNINNIFKLPFNNSVTFDKQGNNWANFNSATIVDGAMYTGIESTVGVFNLSDSLLSFGLSDFEVGLTFKLDSLPSNGCVLLDCFRSTTLGGDGFQVYVYSTGVLSFYQKNTPLLEVKTTTPVVFPGSYRKLKIKRISNVLYVYLDNILVCSGDMPINFDSQWTSIGYQYYDYNSGHYPTRGYFKNVYAKLL